MLTVRGKKCVLLSTPKGRNYFYKMHSLGSDPSELRYASYRGTYLGNPYANMDEISDARKSLPDGIFRQEYLAEFVDGSAVFANLGPRATVTKWEEPVSGERYFAGLDIAATSDYMVLTIVNSKGRVAFCYRDTAKGMPVMLRNVFSTLSKYGPSRTFVETNGIGGGVYDNIKKASSSVRPFVTTSDSKREIIEDLIYDLQDERVTIPAQSFFPHYYDEMSDFGFDYSPKTRKVTYAAISGHDDTVISLALANKARRDGAVAGQYAMESA